MSRARILFSERLGHTVHLGHIDTPYKHQGLRWEDFSNALHDFGLAGAVIAASGATPTTTPTPPAVWGHGNDLAVYPMLGNGPDDSVFPGFQGAGDCEIARWSNATIEADSNAGRPISPFDGSTAIPVYSKLTGYNEHTGANDTGLMTSQVYSFGQSEGMADKNGVIHKMGPSFFAEPGDWVKYCQISYLIEEAGIAWNFTTQMMDQFDANQPWQYVPNQTEEGGHITAGWGPNHTGSWTRNQPFTTLCYQHNCSEVSGFITMERYNAVTGETAEHYSDADLEKFIVLIAQAKTGVAMSHGFSIPDSIPAQDPEPAPEEAPPATEPLPEETPAPIEEPAPIAPDPIPEPAQEPQPEISPAEAPALV